MPRDLVLVRHGQSEGNWIQKAHKQNKKIHVPKRFYELHTCDWRLTEEGVKQALAAGKWIRENIGEFFDLYYVSDYIRAKETAAYFNLPNANWFINFYLGERNWGILDRFTPMERQEKFRVDFHARKINVFYWAPPRGESMVELCQRVDRVLDTLHREYSGKRCLLVCHGEILWAFRIRIERLTVSQYLELDRSKDPKDHFHNCQIIHYSRVDPKTEKIGNHMNWRRIVCPWDMSLSSNDWQKISRPIFTNESLMAEVNKVNRVLAI